MRKFEFKIHYNPENPGRCGHLGSTTQVVHARSFKVALWMLSGLLPGWLWTKRPVYTGHKEIAPCGGVVTKVDRQWKPLTDEFLGLV